MTDEENAARAEKRAQESGDGLPFEPPATRAKAKTGAKKTGAKTITKKRKGSPKMNEKEFLYSPPPAASENRDAEIRAWHKRMVAEYATSKRRVHNVLYKWPRDAGIDQAKMTEYGVEPPRMRHYPPSLTGDAYHRLFDHGRVIRRRRDGALFVLGEPYADLDKLAIDPHVEAWRALGSEVICSADSGWFPKGTVTLLIGEPTQKAQKKGKVRAK